MMTSLNTPHVPRKAHPRLIRSALAIGGFLGLTGILVALQPDRDPLAYPAPDVTRAVTDLSAPVASAEAAAPVQVAAAAPIQALQPAPIAKTAVPEAKFRTDSSDVQSMTAGVLAELGVKVATPASAAPMDAATAGILANIRAVTGVVPAAAPAAPASGLQALVAQALREGQSDSYIDALVNEAAGRGEFSVPKALVTNDGRVDTATILASIVSQARVAAGETAKPVIAGGEGVEVRMVQKASGDVEQFNFYTVSPGDSLGAIAQRFYGDAGKFTQIFEANRAILGSPDRIRTGQRLVIPTT
jgi:nucleoid-associated protein YgaU